MMFDVAILHITYALGLLALVQASLQDMHCGGMPVVYVLLLLWGAGSVVLFGGWSSFMVTVAWSMQYVSLA